MKSPLLACFLTAHRDGRPQAQTPISQVNPMIGMGISSQSDHGNTVWERLFRSAPDTLAARVQATNVHVEALGSQFEFEEAAEVASV